MNMMSESKEPAAAEPERAAGLARLTRVWPFFVAATLGVVLIYGVGLANPETLHNAAHDSRHSFAFPCH